MENKETAAATSASAGLRGVVAAQSSIGDVNGEEGKLIYQGYDIHDLQQTLILKKSSFCFGTAECPTKRNLTN
jgi:citrate synthase